VNLPRTTVPSVLTTPPLLMGIEAELFMPFAGATALLIFMAQSNIWNLVLVVVCMPPLHSILRGLTEKDPFFFKTYQQGFSAPKYLPATSGIFAPNDRVLTKSYN